jgi:TM2 domain-containing membrane protein YozV
MAAKNKNDGDPAAQPQAQAPPASTPAAPQYSPDGRWWFDGQQWVPAPQTATSVIASKKQTAGLLAIFLGGFGVHHFYLGNTNIGVIYLVLACTGISGILGLIEGIMILTSSEEVFVAKNGRMLF